MHGCLGGGTTQIRASIQTMKSNQSTGPSKLRSRNDQIRGRVDRLIRINTLCGWFVKQKREWGWSNPGKTKQHDPQILTQIQLPSNKQPSRIQGPSRRPSISKRSRGKDTEHKK